MKYSSIPSAQLVLQHCKAKGIKNIIISPGSRNAPLTLGFTEDFFFNCFSIVDERCAAFFALGMAQQLQAPVAVVCTSGSALLNYYPAIAEAYYSDIPLVVISADRPQYKIDIGDGQTIRQADVFEKHIGYSANLLQDVVHATDRVRKYTPEMLAGDTIEAAQQKINTINNDFLNEALTIAVNDKTPVHINVPFEEPLYNAVDKLLVEPDYETEVKSVKIVISDLEKYGAIWNTAPRKMILIGACYPKRINAQLLEALSKDPSVVVLTETTSNVHSPYFFPSIDSMIAPIEKLKNRKAIFQTLQPDILLTIGGMIVSKKIKAFLREFTPRHHWHVDTKKAFNTFFCLSHHFKMDVNSFFNQFLPVRQMNAGNYYDRWNKLKLVYEAKREEYIQKIPISDMWVFYHILKKIPKNYQLQLANSSAIRYAQLFETDDSVEVFCNRGTSGIDGSTSTAVGASIYCKHPTLLITGDLSFLYDSNGLWNSYLRPDFRIIVTNNQGGGIFRILPGNDETANFETYFETVHSFDAEHLCKMFNIRYQAVSKLEDLVPKLNGFYLNSDAPQLLEIKTPRVVNNKILMEYFDFISSSLLNH
ncbi:MAG: 2-succinyl-5-enolpyruvyl-6-hydroxy-3-cyclohexene-1-carboxylic-acid synthase [Maribacter sp.]|nr:2-succinyl-5-enolpyruvyl-6-hydroxy-3-cyclohexene-1-carboxylic-acid synthase [Maribacter sp.]